MVTSNVQLVRPLGAGGMGSVWVAEHLALHTQVVVKFMAADLSQNDEAIARFSREAAAAAQVKSPHVVQTLDHGVTGFGAPYIVMELLEGHDLADHLAKHERLAPIEVVAILTQLARALAKAHARGIVHRDIKPSNIFLCDAGSGDLFVKLLDFGIAKAVDLPRLETSTRTGSFVGSPFYMSPEQVIGAKSINQLSDLWSLGVVAFEALTGTKPFFAETVGGLALKIHRDPLPLPTAHDPTLPVAIDAWFARACAREPGDRFPSAKEMADALAVALTGERPAAGVALDSGRRAPGISAFASTTPADVSTLPSATSKAVSADGAKLVGTDAGVGLSSRAVPKSRVSRGKVLAAVAIGGVALLVGFVVPKVIGGAPTLPATPSAPSARAQGAVEPAVTSGPPLTIATLSAPPAPLLVSSAPPSASASVAILAPPIPRASKVAPLAPVVSAPPKPTATRPPPEDDGIK